MQQDVSEDGHCTASHHGVAIHTGVARLAVGFKDHLTDVEPLLGGHPYYYGIFRELGLFYTNPYWEDTPYDSRIFWEWGDLLHAQLYDSQVAQANMKPQGIDIIHCVHQSTILSA